MLIFSNFLYATAIMLDILLKAVWWIILIRVLLSWVNPDPYNIIVTTIYKISEPILKPFRKIMPSYGIGIDISPIFALLALMFCRYFIVKTLFDLSNRLYS